MSQDDHSQASSYILDAENAAEMGRLTKQGRLITAGMGGLAASHHDLADKQQLLDIACGPGGWALDVATTFPQINVVGIDINRQMITYAQAQARALNVANVDFQVMNALHPLAFPDSSFDMVNARFLVGFMPRAAWLPLLHECLRLLRPGGLLHLTEFDEPGTTNSEAFEEWDAITFRATQKAGLTSAPRGRNFGITPLLGRFLQSAGFQQIELKPHVIDFSFGTPAYASMYENCEIAFKLVQPFLLKMQAIGPEEADRKYQQLLKEMRSSEFCGLWYYLTARGIRGM